MTHHSAAHRPQAMNECIDNCTQCHAICLETINYCLTKGGVHAAPEHIALLAT
ncbi:ferredoxin, partial [Xanthomonas citri pv. citri]|nr:ferredoxin [Xanthomonas citri pv. citri]